MRSGPIGGHAEIWNIRSVRRNGRHEAEFPEEQARRVIKLFSPDGRCSPSTHLLARGRQQQSPKQLGRKWIGVDIDERNVAIARWRTNESWRARAA